MGVCWGEKAAKEGRGSFQEEERQEARTPDGNQMYFLGPERIFGTIEGGWGKLNYKKGFLIFFKKKKIDSLGLTFVFLKDVYVTS